MSLESATMFDLELPETVAFVRRKVEALSNRPIETVTVDDEDTEVSRVAGTFPEPSTPRIAVRKGVTPTVEEITVEILRLELRDRLVEGRMPYADMRHAANRKLCKHLFRVMEQEILLAVAQSHGVEARKALQNRLLAEFLDPLEGGKYLPGEADPGRLRRGTLAGLELLVSYVDPMEAQGHLIRVAELDEPIAGQLGLLYKVVENNRPFDDDRRVRAAYYLGVPFLFDTRRPARPSVRLR